MTRGHDLRLLSGACCAWAVVAVVLALGVGVGWCLALGAACTVSSLLLGGWPRLRVQARCRALALLAALTALLVVGTAGHLEHEDEGPVRRLAAEKAIATGRVLITREPRTIPGKKPGAPPVVLLEGRIREITARGHTEWVDTPVVMLAGEPWLVLRWRSTVSFTARLEPSSRLGPARAVLAVRGSPRDVVSPPPWLDPFDAARASLRASFASVPNDPRGLSPALVDGDVSALPEDLRTTMNTVGMSHLNAVSGSNVTIVLVAVVWCAGLVRAGRRTRLLLGGLALVAFVLLCRPESSVIRAAAMGAVGLSGTSAGRPRMACPALGAAIVGLLLWDPWLAVSAGFALSALATLGLVLFARPWTTTCVRRLPGWMAKPCEMTMIPVAAQAPCLPILVSLSGSVSLVSVPANVLAEPLVAPATLGGMGVLLLGFLPEACRHLLAWPVALPSWGIALVARGAERVPGGSLPWPGGVTGVILAVGVLVVPMAWRGVVQRIGRRGIVVLVVVALLPAALLVPVPGAGRARAGWRYAQCDVGQGDGAVVSTGQPGHAIAIDVGPEEPRGMLECLDRHGVRALDAVFLSHFHSDHTGALGRLLDEMSVGPVFVTPVREDAQGAGHGERGAGPQVDADLRRTKRRPIPLPPGRRVNVGSLAIEVLWPRRVLHAGSVQNNASLILDVTARDAHLLFLGDAEKEADGAVATDVAERARRRPYDVVKVGHHGSGNQAPGLYRAAAARYGAIGVGANNDYGHPSTKLLAMLEASNTAVCRTDRHGDITFADDGGGLAPHPERSAC